MKHCPACGRDYPDNTLSFCLEDGSRLIATMAPETLVAPNPVDFPPPTIAANPNRTPPRRSRVGLYLLAGAVMILVAASVVGGVAFLYFKNRPVPPAPLIFHDGTRYEGEQKNGRPEGKGIMLFPTGDVYDGDFREGKREGFGVYTFKSGHKYTGQFKNDAYEGQGRLEYPNRDVYEGEFRNGKFNGQGTFTPYAGQPQTGQWVDGKVAEQ